jgi:hypothetical protein
MRAAICSAIFAIALAFAAAGGSTAASTLCVGGPQCYPTLQAAVNTAHDGDTIRINAGTFAGGVTITKSVNLVGAGAKRTTIQGGGPVLTIGTIFASTEPTVSIDSVTITGGVTTSSPESSPFVGQESVFAAGGGIQVPPGANFDPGATVTISNSVISGNRVAPTQTVPFGPPCPSGPCPYAGAYGGGIDTWGALTLTSSAVSNNSVGGPVASDAEGAGINSHLAALTITASVISGNRALASAPNGRYADTGGVFVTGGSLKMDATLVMGNSATLATSMPDSVDTHGASGGIHIGGDDDCVDPSNCVAATIRNSVVSGNSATATNPAGPAVSFCGGICSDGILTLDGVTAAGNSVFAYSPGADASGDSGGIGPGGPATVRNSRLTGNTVAAKAPNGTATAQGGGMTNGDQDVASSVDSTIVTGNRISAQSSSGQAVVFGAGLSNGGLLTVTNSVFALNGGNADGPAGSAHGGGIWNSSFGFEPPFGTLTLKNSIVSGNMLTARSGITPLGGGLYTDGATTLSGDHITGNSPGNCSGVSC